MARTVARRESASAWRRGLTRSILATHATTRRSGDGRRSQAPPQSSRWRSSSRRHEPGRGEPMRLTAATLIGVTVLAAGCARYPMNHPIRQYDRDYGYRFSSVATTGDEDETFLILSFSGGGTRA